MDNSCTIILYTTRNVLAFDIKQAAAKMLDEITAGLEAEETLVLETTDGTPLILNLFDVIAVEVKPIKKRKSPPSKKIEL